MHVDHQHQKLFETRGKKNLWIPHVLQGRPLRVSSVKKGKSKLNENKKAQRDLKD